MVDRALRRECVCYLSVCLEILGEWLEKGC
jgi:hypothetical protein